MKLHVRYFWALLIALITIAGCKNDDESTGTLVFEVKAMADGEKFVLNKEYTDILGNDYKIELLRMYFSNLTLLKDDGSEVLANEVSYIKFENNHSAAGGDGETIIAEVPAGTYKGLRFALGVDSTLNHGDPNIWPQGHPLSIFNNAHWSWNSGYIFTKVEGRVDTAGNGNFDKTFLYHTGTDTLYREVDFSNASFSVAPGGKFTFGVNLDVQRLFYSDSDTISTPNENITHTSNNFTLAKKLMDNSSKAFYK